MTMTMKRRCVFWAAGMLVGLCLIFLGAPNEAWAADGTMTQDSEGYYLVEDAADLDAINSDLGAKYRLVNDIDLSNFDPSAPTIPLGEWDPIGTWSNQLFTGELDGNGWTIRNLKITGTANHVGLFLGTDGNAKIWNVRLTNVDVAGTTDVGGLVWLATGNSRILNSSVSGTVKGAGSTGLLVGSNIGTVSDSYAWGTVNDTYGSNDSFGGLIGLNYGTVTRSYASAKMDVEDVPDNYAGALIGQNTSGVTGSFWDMDASGLLHSAGGSGIPANSMKTASTFTDAAGWDFDDTWAIIEGVTFPLHRGEYERAALHSLTVADPDDAAAPLVWDRDFSGGYGIYNVKVATETVSVTLSAAPLDSHSEIAIMIDTDWDDEPDTVQNTDSLPGTETLALNPGVNKFWIRVSEPGNGGISADYRLTVIRDTGAPDHPHRITTAEQLAMIGDPLKSYNLNDYYTLDANIDLSAYSSGAGWEPIGEGAGGFQGQFEGNGHTIAGLYIDRGSDANQGLFSSIAGGAEVRNVRLTDVNINGGANTGGLAGVNSGKITGVSISGTVRGAANVGGLVGQNDAGEIADSFALGSVSGLAEVGGLVGLNTGAGAEVSASYAAAEVQLAEGGSGPTGGLVGSTVNGAAVTTSFWDKTVSLQEQSAGSNNDHGKTTADMKKRSTYEADSWSIDPADSGATWGMIEGTTYPLYRAAYEAVVLDSLTVDFNGAGEQWTPPSFAADQGLYEIEASVPTTSAEISVHPPTVTSSVYIDGTSGATQSVSLHPGHNPIGIEVVDQSGVSRGGYTLDLVVPLPKVTAVQADSISDGWHKQGALLQWTVHFSGDVTVAGTPALPWVIGDNGSVTETVYAVYTGSPGTTNSLSFAYTVQNGDLDKDGIQLGLSLETLAGSTVKAAGFTDDAELILPGSLPDLSGVQLDGIAPSVEMTKNPETPTIGAVVVSVSADDGTGSGVAEQKWAMESRDTAYFASGGSPLDSGDQFTATEPGTYSVYAKDAAGNETVKEIAIFNIVTTAPVLELSSSPPPSTSTAGPVTVNVVAHINDEGSGNALAQLRWLPGSHGKADFAGGTNGTDLMSLPSFTVTANGTYTVYAKDTADQETVKEIDISNIRPPSSSGSVPSAEEPVISNHSDGGLIIAVIPAMVERIVTGDGTVREIVNLTEKTMEALIERLKGAEKPFITVAIDDQEAGAVEVRFPGGPFSRLTASYPNAVFKIRSNGSSFQLRVEVLNLEALSEQLGADLKDMKVHVSMEPVDGQEKEMLQETADGQGLTLIGHPVDYRLAVSAGDQTIDIDDFGGVYMVRGLVSDESAAGQNIIAVWFDPENRALHFVPAAWSTRADGKLEMEMQAPHNSIYALAESEGKSFADLRGHWAKQDVERLASKLIISGVAANRFAPDQSITRAEFAALLVRSLGLATKPAASDPQFVDVDAKAWYAPAVETAAKAGLVQGTDAKHFAPNGPITREQIAVMIAKALELTGAATGETDDGKALSSLADRDSISPWAKEAVAQSVAAGIIGGYPDGTFAPQQRATRAEAAAMLKHFLQHVGFIN